jgi:putative heme iron utilization protein
MRPDPEFDPQTLTRSLLRRRRQGALATLMAEDGAPYCSLVNVASDVDGAPILLISRLAVHTRNILADPRVSLMLDERAAGDSLEGARIMVAGEAHDGTGDALPGLRRRYLNAHPDAENFVDFPDFGFFRVRIDSVHLVAGFGRIVDLIPEQILTDLTGCEPLIEAEPDIVAHMNAEHLDAMKLYATKLAGAAAGDENWRCTGCDPDGIDLANGAEVVRIPFPERVRDPMSLRAILRRLANEARGHGH